jgi:hypothetical protein
MRMRQPHQSARYRQYWWSRLSELVAYSYVFLEGKRNYYWESMLCMFSQVSNSILHDIVYKYFIVVIDIDSIILLQV